LRHLSPLQWEGGSEKHFALANLPKTLALPQPKCTPLETAIQGIYLTANAP